MKKEWPEKASPQQRAAVKDALRRLHSKYPGRILSTVLFGSVARGDFTRDSDIDVLVVVDRLDVDFKWDIWGVGSQVSLEFDVILDLHVFSQAHWGSLRAKHRTLWRNVERDGIELKLQSEPDLAPA